jgi:hypothetical protein
MSALDDKMDVDAALASGPFLTDAVEKERA